MVGGVLAPIHCFKPRAMSAVSSGIVAGILNKGLLRVVIRRWEKGSAAGLSEITHANLQAIEVVKRCHEAPPRGLYKSPATRGSSGRNMLAG